MGHGVSHRKTIILKLKSTGKRALLHVHDRCPLERRDDLQDGLVDDTDTVYVDRDADILDEHEAQNDLREISDALGEVDPQIHYL